MRGENAHLGLLDVRGAQHWPPELEVTQKSCLVCDEQELCYHDISKATNCTSI